MAVLDPGLLNLLDVALDVLLRSLCKSANSRLAVRLKDNADVPEPRNVRRDQVDAVEVLLVPHRDDVTKDALGRGIPHD